MVNGVGLLEYVEHVDNLDDVDKVIKIVRCSINPHSTNAIPCHLRFDLAISL